MSEPKPCACNVWVTCLLHFAQLDQSGRRAAASAAGVRLPHLPITVARRHHSGEGNPRT